MQTCTIFSPLPDTNALESALQALAGDTQVSLEDGQLVVWQRRILTRQRLQFQPTVPGEQFGFMCRSLRHVYGALPTSHGAIREALLQRIQDFQTAVVVTGKKLVGMENLIFGAAKALDGLVFWGGNEMLDAKGKLVMNFAGKTNLSVFDGAKAATQAPLPVFTPEAIARKALNDEALKARKIPLNPAAQPLDDIALVLKETNAVIDRMLALLLTALKGNGLPQAEAAAFATAYDILPLLSPAELDFFHVEAPEEAARVVATWRFEAWWAALFALGWVPQLAFPDGHCEPDEPLQRLYAAGSRTALYAQMQLRPREELLAAADLTKRLHWAFVDSYLRREDPPAGILTGALLERHRFFQWLLQPIDWDAATDER
jgi:hypothetical protein